MPYPAHIQRTIDLIAKLPGIGPKTAERLAVFLLKSSPAYLAELGQALAGLQGQTKTCRSCNDFAETDPCPICADGRRSRSVLCVVAKPQDVQAIEKTGAFEGTYYILGAALDPLGGVTPDQIATDGLLQRIGSGQVAEIILGLNPDIEGETTVLYLKKLIAERAPGKVRLTRLARGLPMGGDIEYADDVTLSSALQGRREV